MTHQAHPSVTREVVQVLAEHGFDGMAQAMELLINECMKIERQQALGVGPYQRGEGRRGQANGFKPKQLKKPQVGELRLAGAGPCAQALCQLKSTSRHVVPWLEPSSRYLQDDPAGTRRDSGVPVPRTRISSRGSRTSSAVGDGDLRVPESLGEWCELDIEPQGGARSQTRREARWVGQVKLGAV